MQEPSLVYPLRKGLMLREDSGLPVRIEGQYLVGVLAPRFHAR